MTSIIRHEDIYNGGSVVFETDMYQRIRNYAAPIKYDDNFILFKQIPTLEAFIEVEAQEDAVRKNEGLGHFKVKFPLNGNLSSALKWHIELQGYHTGKMEIYQMSENRIKKQQNSAIMIEVVTEQTLPIFLQLSEKIDRTYGENFVKVSAMMSTEKIKDPRIELLLAYYNKTPVGNVICIQSNNDLQELDSLFVAEKHRNQGVASCLQQFILERKPHKKLFLIADALDTPRIMYQNQGYKLISEWDEIQIVDD
ncbi:MAG: GNAT family N-acetyltransferase [Culicoidibacterales bacterium]